MRKQRYLIWEIDDEELDPATIRERVRNGGFLQDSEVSLLLEENSKTKVLDRVVNTQRRLVIVAIVLLVVATIPAFPRESEEPPSDKEPSTRSGQEVVRSAGGERTFRVST